jgi:peptide/nickel transport system permease protein
MSASLPVPVAEMPAPPRSGFFRRFAATGWGPFAAGLVALFVAMALLAPLIALHSPYQGGENSLLPPLAPGHPLGTDDLGRDIWSELVFGARVSLIVGVLAAGSGLIIGVAIGALAGYCGGWTDGVLMRIAEFFQTLPRFVLALIIIGLFGPGIGKVIAVIGVLSWPQTARVVRASFASLRQASFVEAARIGGMPTHLIILREILPNAAAPLIVMGALDIATAILLEAGLGFFGLGDPNLVSWGSMLNEAQQYLQTAWWMAVFPGLAIALVVLGFNLLADALNAVLDPRSRSR